MPDGFKNLGAWLFIIAGSKFLSRVYKLTLAEPLEEKRALRLSAYMNYQYGKSNFLDNFVKVFQLSTCRFNCLFSYYLIGVIYSILYVVCHVLILKVKKLSKSS
jgi:hypothetical protein